MADISVTASSVIGDTTNAEIGTAGAAITAGQPLALVSGALVPADVDHATAAYRTVVGIALQSVSSGQPILYQKKGNVTYNAVLSQGTIYVASDTAGGIMPAADLEAGDYVVIVGVGSSTTVMQLLLNNTGIVVA